MKNIHDAYVRDLDLNLLRVLAVVAEEGSITRAAARLYVTQPAVSSAMRRLSSFIGAELFAREGRGLTLTSRGADLAIAARAHLVPLVASAIAVPAFEAKASTALVRIGLADTLECSLLPALLTALREAAPLIQLVILSVQFRTVEEAILSRRVDLAVSIADELPRSILRKPLLFSAHSSGGLVCLFDARFTKLKKTITEREYFAREHVAVSYAGDVRGIIEDALGKTRNVRISVPAFGYVADVIDGTSLLATVPKLLAKHLSKTRPHLSFVPLPFSLEPVTLDLLWSRVQNEDKLSIFMRDVITKCARALS